MGRCDQHRGKPQEADYEKCLYCLEREVEELRAERERLAALIEVMSRAALKREGGSDGR